MITSLIETGRPSLFGVIYHELLQGTKDDEEALHIPNTLSALKYFEMTPAHGFRPDILLAGSDAEE